MVGVDPGANELNPNIQATVQAAVDGWNAAGQGNTSAPQFFFIGVGSADVTVQAGQVTGGVASWEFTRDQAGNITGGIITADSSTSGAMPYSELQSNFSHEFGHGVGLNDATASDGCSQTDTVMFTGYNPSQPFACAPTSCDSTAENNNYPPPPAPDPPPSGGCVTDADCTCGGTCMKNGTCMYTVECSPIIIAVGQSADIQLTSPEDGVSFDLQGNGVPQQVAWTRAGDPVAFLVLDRNNNGMIDNGSELFGNHTFLPDGQLAPNGFFALAAYDQSGNGGNGDGVIDARDAIWSQLRLWIDWNHNGFSEANELYRLEDFGLTQISLDYRATDRQDAFGNVFRLKAPCTLQGEVRFGYDVYFTARPPPRPNP